MSDARIRPKAVGLSGKQLLARWIVRGRMTQAEAADQIGVSRVKLNQYLQGVARPSLETATRIEDATGIGMRAWLVEEPEQAPSAAPSVS
jgi:transcriptional regulator with XRE-family HTH domain